MARSTANDMVAATASPTTFERSSVSLGVFIACSFVGPLLKSLLFYHFVAVQRAMNT